MLDPPPPAPRERVQGRVANDDRPVGAASCRQEQCTMASCQTPRPHDDLNQVSPLGGGGGGGGDTDTLADQTACVILWIQLTFNISRIKSRTELGPSLA